MQVLSYIRAGILGGLLLGSVSGSAAPTILVSGTGQRATNEFIPAAIALDLARYQGMLPLSQGRLELVSASGSDRTAPILAQFEPEGPGSPKGVLRWLMPASRGASKWILAKRNEPVEPVLLVRPDLEAGHWTITEGGQPVLTYNYLTNPLPADVRDHVRPADQKYARARGDYIHPLCGPDGEELTRDLPLEHPHHRGIYWAWPEVDYRGERGDLHALQRVFARPTGRCLAQSGAVFARIEARNVWLWENRDPIVDEVAIVRAWRSSPGGRFLDLELRFTALRDEVSIARRETTLYGGLNIRLSPAKEQRILTFTDPRGGGDPRRAWAELSGLFPGGKAVAGLAVFQNPANPDNPGDWIQYPEINWFQPTFPATGTRYALRKGQPLVLQYRLWVHAGRSSDERLAELWTAYAHPPEVRLGP